ncbi:HalD/BesD family halogenase [Roseospira goensis]|uniref:Fe2OG dioxygenase domain-containing protein n=1 Tax=Roseospira goensis TaxID=391922 RepID=A0A7W6WJL1_9PROT|nr:hypothetical protein [Roseospira goensis]MBB4284789.1 hypothetical protein [Roseospira goensis]
MPADPAADVSPTPAPTAHLADPIALDRYPIADLATTAAQALVADCRRQLAADGCVVLEGFVRPEARAALAAESARLAPRAHFNSTETNPYNSAGDPTLPPTHPRNIFGRRDNGFVAGDRIPAETLVRRLYHDTRLQRFVAACVGVETIHEYADPLAGLVINVLRPGCQHPWHYDTNEFIVSLMTRRADGGGRFEYCPGIRAPGDENEAAVGAVLHGDRTPVRSLDLRVGDLQIFHGRYALHRVAPVEGERERHTLILGYATEPGVVGRAARTRAIFGRVTQAHLDAERSRVRADTLAD